MNDDRSRLDWTPTALRRLARLLRFACPVVWSVTVHRSHARTSQAGRIILSCMCRNRPHCLHWSRLAWILTALRRPARLLRFACHVLWFVTAHRFHARTSLGEVQLDPIVPTSKLAPAL